MHCRPGPHTTSPQHELPLCAQTIFPPHGRQTRKGSQTEDPQHVAPGCTQTILPPHGWHCPRQFCGVQTAWAMTIDESQAASAMTASCASSTSALTTCAFMRSPERALLKRAVMIQMVRIKSPPAPQVLRSTVATCGPMSTLPGEKHSTRPWSALPTPPAASRGTARAPTRCRLRSRASAPSPSCRSSLAAGWFTRRLFRTASLNGMTAIYSARVISSIAFSAFNSQ